MAVQLQPKFLTERFENLTFQEKVERSMSQESNESDFEIKEVNEKDKHDIINFARRFFNKDEPLNEDIALTESDGRCQALESYILSTLDEGTSVKAVSDGKLVAFSMNGIACRGDENDKPNVDNPKFQMILDFLHHNTVECDIFGRYPNVEKAMSVKIVSVDPCMRGKGVATKLVEKTRDIAKEHGCELMFVECTSFFSALIMKRLGFKKIYSLDYCDYKVDDKVVFNPKSPHTEYSVYVQELEKCQ